MTFLTGNLHWITLACSAIILFAATVLFFRRRSGADTKDTLGLKHLVTLNSGGWLILSIVAALGAVVMIGSSVAIGIDYWTGLAINADVTAGRIDPLGEWYQFATVGVISFCVLAIFFELMSDLGTPLSSGFRQRQNVALANFVIVAAIGCVFMSLITKWGYYDDKANVRRVEGAKITVEDAASTKARTDAEATIERLKSTPSSDVADAKATAAEAKIASLTAELADAKAAREAIPESHSTNRLAAGREVARVSGLLQEAVEEKVAVAIMRDNIAAKAAAVKTLEAATTAIEKNAGEVGSLNGGGHTKAGDWFAVRLIRVALHQFLCWLFPLVFFESVAAHGDALKKERADRKRRQTVEDKKNTIDVEPVDIRTATPREPLGLTAAGLYEEQQAKEAEERAELERRKKKKDRGAGTPVAPGYRNGSDDDGPELPETAEDTPEEPDKQGALDDN